MTTYRRPHRRLVPVRRSLREGRIDPNGWYSILLAVLVPWIVCFLAWLYARALQ